MVIFRSLGRKYAFISLLLLAFFSTYLVASFLFLHYLSGDALKINIAGRQRMLTVALSSHMHFITSNEISSDREHHIRRAEKTMDEYEAMLFSLRDGNAKIGLEPVHPYDKTTRGQLDLLIELWQGTQRPLLRDIMRAPDRNPENCTRCHAAIREKFPEIETFVRNLERHHDDEIRNFTIASFGALGLLVVMMGLVFLFVRRTLIAPVTTLRRAAAELERGNFAVATDVKSHDEIGDLGRSFNQMALSLAALFREKAEHLEELNVLHQVGQAAAGSLSLERMLQQVLGALRKLKPFEKAAVFLCEEDGRALRLAASLHFTPEHVQACAAVARGECLCGRCLKRGETIDSRNSTEDPRHTRTYPGIAPHGHLVLPLRSRDRILGVLSLYLTAGEVLADKDVKIFGAVADLLSVSVHNAINHRQVAILAQSLDTSMDLVIITDPTGRILHVNPQATAYLGHTREELIGQDIALLHPDSAFSGQWDEILRHTLAEGTWKGEISSMRGNGRAFPVLLATAQIYYEQEKVIALVGIARDISAQREAERDLRIKDWAIRSSSYGVVFEDLEHVLQFVNPAFLRMWHYDTEREVLGKTCSAFWKDAERSEEIMAELRSVGTWTGEREGVRRDGTTFPVDVTATVVKDQSGRAICLMAALSDASERKRAEESRRGLEAQLLQAQKLESLGRLAGGVAHDFNNLLTVILSHCDMAAARIDADHPLRASLRAILDAGERAADLTHQLLAFSRKQVLELQVVPLNAVIEQIIRMLTRIIGEDIVMELHLASTRTILADAVQIGQIIMNLAINARDAMPAGGRLAIETANVELGAGDPRLNPAVPPGPHVLLTVSDTGAGMTPEVLEKIFDPFFTTKEQGKGTGLGLATVYGIVVQHQGTITVSSDPGRGATFRICLPAVDRDAHVIPAREVEIDERGTETILVVEDEAPIRDLISQVLTPLGYRLILAGSGEEALEAFAAAGDEVDLLLSDVIMPGMNGYELADRLKEQQPGLLVLMMSGYNEQAAAASEVARPRVSFLPKPLTPPKLRRAVRKVLSEGQSQNSG
jgi:PAS domain S-box-containing protein